MSTTAAVTVKERPILFSGSMVRAILEGRKTQTRRVMKLQPYTRAIEGFVFPTRAGGFMSQRSIVADCPYGVPGDRLWVRETWGIGGSGRLMDPCLNYRADGAQMPLHKEGPIWCDSQLLHAVSESVLLRCREGWRPSIHMPRWASRLMLEITAVRVERVKEISEEDAIAEGAKYFPDIPLDPGHELYPTNAPRWCMEEARTTADTLHTARQSFANLWNKLGYGWDANPWVWVVEFRRAR